MTKEFADVRIVGLDAARSRPSTTAPGLRQVYFTLSSAPPSDWVRAFEAERRYPRHAHWRNAWVEGVAIVVDCDPEEIESHHLPDLRQDVESTNRLYRAHLARLQRVSHRRDDAEAEERQRLEEIGSRLQF